MGSTLTNGIYLPAEGERNCYEGLAANWTALDRLIGGYNAHVGNATIHVTAAEKETWNGKADNSALTAHTGNTTIHVTAEDKEAWNGKADASALTAHTGDTTIHVTAEDKQAWNGHVADLVKHVTAEDKEAWNGKADASALTAHTGNTTIHVTAADKQAWDGHVADSVKHVTAEDKAKWDAVTSKANDSDVVHKSGNETISGNKTFSSINGVEPSSLSLPSGNANDVIDISSYITDLRGNANNYTAPANGWISITMRGCSGVQAYIAGLWGHQVTRPSVGDVRFLMPSLKNLTASIFIFGGTIDNARFIPCRGNV